MSRDERVRPWVSSSRAWRVRATSTKPKASSRADRAPAGMTGPPGRSPLGRTEKASKSGRKKRRSWMERTAPWCACRSSSKWSTALVLGSSR